VSRAAILLGLLCVAGCGGLYQRPPHTTPPPRPGITVGQGELRDVVLVGNNWAGTVTVFDPQTFDTLAVIDVVPDWNVQVEKIKKSPIRKAAFALIRKAAGEGNHQLVDDVFMSKDGRVLMASRPSFADVVAIDVATGAIKWTAPVAGVRADHAALSPNKKTLLVSASTAGKVHAIDTESGTITGEFTSGDEPHESNYSQDGAKIYHASIGRVFLTPPTLRILDGVQGRRVFQIVDATSMQVLETFDMQEETKKAGCAWPHASVRPMAVTRDDKSVFFQLSFFHGFFEFDLEQKRITRRVELPVPDDVKRLPLDEYQLNSAHHGIALSGDEQQICVAGTMSGYAAIVDRATLAVPNADGRCAVTKASAAIVEVGPKPYWATASADGQQCYVSVSKKNLVAVISFKTKSKLRDVSVGVHPQRVRTGQMLITDAK
jgi:DNA-binding beta-propeller fold protein YncE